MKKWSRVIMVGLVGIGLCVAVGLKHDRRNPNQHWNQYWAVRELDVWSVFGWEIYARNRLAVYDMTNRTTDDLPHPLNSPSLQVRRFGTITQGDQQFGLGENDYQREKCITFIRETLREQGIEP